MKSTTVLIVMAAFLGLIQLTMDRCSANSKANWNQRAVLHLGSESLEMNPALADLLDGGAIRLGICPAKSGGEEGII